VYDGLQVFLCAKRDMNLLWLNGDSRMRDGGGGGCCRRLQGKSINNEIEFEVHTGGRYTGDTGGRYTGDGVEPNRRW
jgi:hypothetical protein